MLIFQPAEEGPPEDEGGGAKMMLAEGIFDSSSQKTYQSLLDQEWSRKLSNNASFGIAEAIKLQFKNQMNALETKSDV